MTNLNIINLLKKRWVLIAIFIIILGSYFIYGTIQKETTYKKQILSKPTPTPAILASAIFYVSPANKSINVELYPEITVVFTNPLSPVESSSVTIKSSPLISGEQQFSSDYKTLTISVSKALDVNKNYLLSIEVNGVEIYSWTFTTSSLENVSSQDQARAQTEADLNFSKNAEEISNSYPWRENLPLQTDDYFLYFDIEKEVFVGKIYLNNEPQASVENRINSLKEQILLRLKALGVDTSRYQFIWKTVP